MKRFLALMLMLCVLIAPTGLAELLLEDARTGEQGMEFLETDLQGIPADLTVLELDDPMGIELPEAKEAPLDLPSDVKDGALAKVNETNTGVSGVYDSDAVNSTGIPKDGVCFDGHWYKAYKLPYDYNEANEYCRSVGGHLVTITSQAEMNAIEALANDAGRDYYYRIGALEYYSSQTNEYSYEWVTGEPWGYTNWAAGEPYDTDESGWFCIVLSRDWEHWNWFDMGLVPSEEERSYPVLFWTIKALSFTSD